MWMAGKKGKTLALKLIDDLLGTDKTKVEKSGAFKSESQQSDETKALEKTGAGPTFAQKSVSIFDLSSTELASEKKAESEEDAETYRIEDPNLNFSGHDSNTKTEKLTEVKKTKTVIPATPDDEASRASLGRFANLRSGGSPITSTEVALAHSETLRVAQKRILELEEEIERLRCENEQLGAAGETLKRRSDENLARAESIQAKYEQLEETGEHEKELLAKSANNKEKQIQNLRLKIEELEMRLSTNIQKIRVRERELENRLELVMMENTAIVRSKDELILDLKRQLDQMNVELDNYRNKGQELNRHLSDKQELLRRTVKALRLALSMLEGDEESLSSIKPKAS